MRKTRIVLAFVAAYLILILFGHLPDHLILFPTKAPIDAGEAARKMVPFQNGELEVWTASPIERSNRPARRFTFCASTATLIARIAGSQPRRKNGMGELSRFGE